MADSAADFIRVAISRYADACSPPVSLHPDCPFPTRDGEGGATCELECRDVLVQLTRPGLAKGSAQTVGAYDARQIRLTEAGDRPAPNWHTASLMTTLNAAISTPPFARRGDYNLLRHVDLTSALAYLGHRGYDIERLVREAFTRQLPSALALWIARVATQSSGKQVPAAGDWIAALDSTVLPGAPGSPTPGQMLALIYESGFINYIERWLAFAPLDHILDWRFYPGASGEPVPNDGTSRWLVERFAKTYLTDWSDESLRHEYRYGRGDTVTESRIDLRQRHIDQAEVARHLADRSVDVRPSSRLDEVKAHAIALLDDGRRLEAAALFDAARIMEPQNWEAHNNYGFCVTLDHPETALEALRHAEKLEPKPYPLNRVNQAVALGRLEHFPEALAELERAHDQRDHFDGKALMWAGLDEPSGATLASVDPIAYMCEVGLWTAEQAEDPERVAAWQQRLEEAERPIAPSLGEDPS